MSDFGHAILYNFLEAFFLDISGFLSEIISGFFYNRFINNLLKMVHPLFLYRVWFALFDFHCFAQ